jgi:hypothetical protein
MNELFQAMWADEEKIPFFSGVYALVPGNGGWVTLRNDGQNIQYLGFSPTVGGAIDKYIDWKEAGN